MVFTSRVEEHRLQQLRLKATCDGVPCVLEFVLRPEGKGFVVLDANLYSQSR